MIQFMFNFMFNLSSFRYESYVSSPLFPIVASVSFYFVSIIPWMIIDLYGKDWKWIQKYKIQPEKEVTWPMIRKAVYLTTWNHVSITVSKLLIPRLSPTFAFFIQKKPLKS